LGRTDREQARGQRREARGNSQTAGKLWCDPPQVSKDHDACRFTQNAGTVPGYFLRCALVSIPTLKEILLMSRLASSKTAKIWAERIAKCERSNAPVAQAYPGRRFALPWAISFCPFGADGSIDSQEFNDHQASN